jgi:hypothetical protein
MEAKDDYENPVLCPTGNSTFHPPAARNTTENGITNPHSQDATAFQRSVFLTGILRLLVIDS